MRNMNEWIKLARSQEFAMRGAAVSEVLNQTGSVCIWNWNGFVPEIR